MLEASNAPAHNQSDSFSRPRDVRLQVGFSFFAFILIGGIDAAGGVILPSIRAFYGIDKATFGFIFMAGTLGYLTSAFTSGLLVQKLGMRLFMMAGPTFVILAAITISSAPPFALLLLGYYMSGFGIGVIDAGLNSYIAGLPRNTALLNFLHAFYGVGALLGPLVATTVLVLGLGWNSVYYVWLSLGVILLIGVALAFRGFADRTHEHEHATEGKQGNVLAAALRLRAVWIGAFFLLVYVGAEVSLGSWGFSFLTEERHQPETPAGLAISGFWLGLTVGRLILGKLGEKVGNRRLIELCLAGVVVGVLLVWLVPVGIVMAAGLWIAGFSLGPIFPTAIAMMSEMVSARVLPSAIGFMTSFSAIGGAFLPAVAGAISEGAGLWALMPYVMGLALLLLGLWVMLVRQHHGLTTAVQ